MLCPHDFVSYVLKSSHMKDRVVLARAALNILFDIEQYPVDLAEVAGLRSEGRLMVRAFLAWVAVNPHEHLSWPYHLCEPLIDLVDEKRKEGRG